MRSWWVQGGRRTRSAWSFMALNFAAEVSAPCGGRPSGLRLPGDRFELDAQGRAGEPARPSLRGPDPTRGPVRPWPHNPRSPRFPTPRSPRCPPCPLTPASDPASGRIIRTLGDELLAEWAMSAALWDGSGRAVGSEQRGRRPPSTCYRGAARSKTSAICRLAGTWMCSAATPRRGGPMARSTTGWSWR